MSTFKNRCDNCSNEFLTNRESAHFCNMDCYKAFRARAYVTKNCEYCNKPFETREYLLGIGKGRCCSKKCFDLARETKIEIECGQCGKPFLSAPSSIDRGRKYCSSECFHQYTVRTGNLIRNCARCDKEFTAKKSFVAQGGGVYCSAKCQAASFRTGKNVNCLYCGKEFYTVPFHLKIGQGKYCSHACYLKGCYRDTGGTNIEKVIAALLIDMNIDHEPQHRIGKYICDFFIPSAKLAIEADGNYWHSSPKAQAKDAKKDKHLASLGFTVLRLPEDKILKDKKWCREQITLHLV